jgi:hypothetical protein
MFRRPVCNKEFEVELLEGFRLIEELGETCVGVVGIWLGF